MMQSIIAMEQMADYGSTIECDTPLHEAARSGDHNQLKQLLCDREMCRNINSKNMMGCTPLRLAASGNVVLIDVVSKPIKAASGVARKISRRGKTFQGGGEILKSKIFRPKKLFHEFHEICHSVTFIVMVNSHQR